MKYLLTALVIVLMVGCGGYVNKLSPSSCTNASAGSFNYEHDVKAAMDELVRNGVPGCVVGIHSRQGWWSSAAGFANLETKTPVGTCHLQYLQSISKTYLAVGILKLHEEGRINIDSSIIRYLPKKHLAHLPEPHRLTVRMLLNHTSGLPDYNFSPRFVSKLIQNPDFPFTPEMYLSYVANKGFDFEPRSKYSYRNLNYVILALIADAVTGDHARYLSETIFQPLGLRNTFYRAEENYLNYPNIVSSYWDRYSNGILENASYLQRKNVEAMIGDDGIVTTPADGIRFLKGLMEGKIIKEETLTLMKTWEKDAEGNFTYGLGLDYATFRGQVAYGHSGGGIGAGAHLYYFPKQELYVFSAINLGTVTDSPLHKNAAIAIDKLYQAILRE